MTQTLPAPSPYENPSPRRIFLCDASAIDKHHAMVASDAFQTAIAVAQREYTRAMCSLTPLGQEGESSPQVMALHMARLQGANDIIAMLSGLAELPKMQAPKKNSDNLE